MSKILGSLTFDDIHPMAIGIQKLNGLFGLLHKYKLKSTIFVIPFCNGKSICDDKEYVDTIKNMIDEGHEVGLHGFEHKKHEFGYKIEFPYPSFDTQIKKIEKSVKILENLFGTKIYGFRSPCYEHNNFTMKALYKLKFSYDSSKTVFKPTHIPKYGIRFRTFTPPKPYFVYNDLIEIPVTGDYTNGSDSYTSFTYNLKNLNSDIELVCKENGTFIINNHLQHIPMDEYEKFLQTLNHIDNIKIYDLIDICDKYRQM